MRPIAKMMRAAIARSAIVDRADEDDAYGILTFQEIVYRVIAKSLSPTRTRIGEVMIKPLIVVNPTLRLPFVAQLFARFGIQNAIVIDEHKLVGVISSSDLVMALAKRGRVGCHAARIIICAPAQTAHTSRRKYMDFGWTEEETMWRKAVRDFAQKKIAPRVRGDRRATASPRTSSTA